MGATQSTPTSPSSAAYLAESSSESLIVANSCILAFCTTLYALRLYSRTLVKASTGWDEILLIPSYLSLVATNILVYLMVDLGGTGRHQQAFESDLQVLSMNAKLLYAIDWFYLLSDTLPRIAIILLYLRIFTDKTTRFFAWATLTFLCLYCFTCLLVSQIQCIPLEYTWDKAISGWCINQVFWYQLANLPNPIADTAILLLPMKTVWTLKTSFGRRASIAFVCLTGSIGLVASIVRTIYFFTSFSSFPTDNTWGQVNLLTWTAVEPGLYFAAACLIGLRPLVTVVSNKLRSLTNHSSNPRHINIRIPSLIDRSRGGTRIRGATRKGASKLSNNLGYYHSRRDNDETLRGDLDSSMTHINSSPGTFELEDHDHLPLQGTGGTGGASNNGEIRVDTIIEITRAPGELGEYHNYARAF